MRSRASELRPLSTAWSNQHDHVAHFLMVESEVANRGIDMIAGNPSDISLETLGFCGDSGSLREIEGGLVYLSPECHIPSSGIDFWQKNSDFWIYCVDQEIPCRIS